MCGGAGRHTAQCAAAAWACWVRPHPAPPSQPLWPARCRGRSRTGGGGGPRWCVCRCLPSSGRRRAIGRPQTAHCRPVADAGVQSRRRRPAQQGGVHARSRRLQAPSCRKEEGRPRAASVAREPPNCARRLVKPRAPPLPFRQHPLSATTRVLDTSFRTRRPPSFHARAQPQAQRPALRGFDKGAQARCRPRSRSRSRSRPSPACISPGAGAARKRGRARAPWGRDCAPRRPPLPAGACRQLPQRPATLLLV